MFGIYIQVVCVIVRAFLEKKNDDLPNGGSLSYEVGGLGGRWFRSGLTKKFFFLFFFEVKWLNYCYLFLNSFNCILR